MSEFSAKELFASMIVHLSPDALKAQKGVETNADVGREAKDADGGGKDDHYFLLIERGADGKWLLQPLFSKPAKGNEKLNEALKGGEANNWVGQDSYVSPFQHWRASDVAIVAAQKNDTSVPGNRRSYARNSPEELTKLANMVGRNRNGFRPFGERA